MAGQRSFNLWQKLGRAARYKLVVPIQRSAHPPEYTALGVAVGLGWAMTPLVGIQMPLTFLTWVIMRSCGKSWDFNLIVALAWNWVSNVFTMAPLYYVFYLTGQVMLLRWHDLTGYATFVDLWNEVLAGEQGFWEQVLSVLGFLVQQQGLALAVGCLPFAVLGFWQGYVQSLKFMKARQEKLAARRGLRNDTIAPNETLDL